jgi:hypothetical protein
MTTSSFPGNERQGIYNKIPDVRSSSAAQSVSGFSMPDNLALDQVLFSRDRAGTDQWHFRLNLFDSLQPGRYT